MIAMAIINDPERDHRRRADDRARRHRAGADPGDAAAECRDEFNTAIILITHDLGVIAGMADRVLVMYAGRLVEPGLVDDVFDTPRMPYTVGLLGSIPTIDHVGELTPIQGAPPSLINLPPGCPFSPRCPLARAECSTIEPDLDADRPARPPRRVPATGDELVAVDGRHRAVRRGRGARHDGGARRRVEPARRPRQRDTPLLEVNDLVKHFPIRGGGLDPPRRRRGPRRLRRVLRHRRRRDARPGRRVRLAARRPPAGRCCSCTSRRRARCTSTARS